MPFYIKISDETIEKLKGKIRPNIMKYLKARILTKTNTSESEAFRKRLRYFGAKEEEISSIISNCKKSKPGKSEKKPTSVCLTLKKINNVLLEISNETIEKLKSKLTTNIIKYLKARILTKSNISESKALVKKLRSYGAKEEEISLIISNCEVVSEINENKKNSTLVERKNVSSCVTPKKINNVLLGISKETIHKLKNKISYEKINLLLSIIYITHRQEDLKKKLRTMGFQEGEIILIINNSEVLTKADFREFKNIRNRLLLIQEQQKIKNLKKCLTLGHKSMTERKYEEAINYYREAMAIKVNDNTMECYNKALMMVDDNKRIERERKLAESNIEISSNVSRTSGNKTRNPKRHDLTREEKERLAKKIYQYRNSSVTDVYHLLPTANYKDDT